MTAAAPSSPPMPTAQLMDVPQKERKAAEVEAKRAEAEAELKANGGKPDEAEHERIAMNDYCKALHVEMKEINPDGHW